MTTKEFMDFLTGPAEARRTLSRLQETLALKECQCQKMTTSYDGVGGCGGGGGPKDSALASLADFSVKRDQAADEYLTKKYAVQRFLGKLSTAGDPLDARHALLLKSRYFDGKLWDQVSEELRLAGFPVGCRMTLYNWNLAALKRGHDVWEVQNA